MLSVSFLSTFNLYRCDLTENFEIASVQSERERSDNNARADVDDDGDETVCTSAVEIDTELVNVGTQTDYVMSQNSSNNIQNVVCMTNERQSLIAYDNELLRVAEQIVELHNRVCKRNDKPSNCPPSRSHISFADAFQNPLLICSRSRLTPTGERIASMGDVLQDWRRCFVLYVDWLREFDEFNTMSNEDQWLKLMAKAYMNVPTELIDVSLDGQKHMRDMLDRYLRVIYNHIRFNNPAQTNEFIAFRMARIMLLISSITNLTYLTNENIQLNDVLHIVDWGACSERIHDSYQ
ncbi:unnamed protein product [Anisakis simplex]|uniref:Hormone receptor 83 (inferred by orthology to a D. melanogaster protein) n=1 Tax=Anisakis simplex TaxID=6269 RepID=A0A0M3JTI6_ANISI|nr:unnamed protein product [Anisakis simplex]